MNAIIKINEIVNEFLLAGEKFTPEMHLKQHGFTYSACGPFTKIKERIEKFTTINLLQKFTTKIYYKNLLQLVEELHKPIIKKFKKRRVYS